MESNHIRQIFISGLLAVLSVTSLAFLRLWFATPRTSGQTLVSLFNSGKISLLDLYQRFPGSGSFWQSEFLRECLLANLVLLLVFCLFSFFISRHSK